jgi:hypothetical protein
LTLVYANDRLGKTNPPRRAMADSIAGNADGGGGVQRHATWCNAMQPGATDFARMQNEPTDDAGERSRVKNSAGQLGSL